MITSSREVVVIIPTYNEIDNVRRIISCLELINVEFSILFVDDNSPDGTGRLLAEIASEMRGLHILHRSGKLGIGSAHKDGIKWAYQHGYQKAITMDCDFTHNPSEIPNILEQSEVADSVVASRFLKAKSLPGWSVYRKTLTIVGHRMTKICIGIR